MYVLLGEDYKNQGLERVAIGKGPHGWQDFISGSGGGDKNVHLKLNYTFVLCFVCLLYLCFIL